MAFELSDHEIAGRLWINSATTTPLVNRAITPAGLRNPQAAPRDVPAVLRLPDPCAPDGASSSRECSAPHAPRRRSTRTRLTRSAS
jgi:hypothetical protein